MITLKQKLQTSHFLNGTKLDKLNFKQFVNKLTRMKCNLKKLFTILPSQREKKFEAIMGIYKLCIHPKRSTTCPPLTVNVDSWETDDMGETSEILND